MLYTLMRHIDGKYRSVTAPPVVFFRTISVSLAIFEFFLQFFSSALPKKPVEKNSKTVS